MSPKPDFPPVRACLFDMDGLLLNTEDLYTEVMNTVLRRYGRPDLPWSIKAQLQGRPGAEADAVFLPWAQLPISPEQWQLEYRATQAELFKRAAPLPGAEDLLRDLVATRALPDVQLSAAAAAGQPQSPLPTPPLHRVHFALATSSSKASFDVKTQTTARNRVMFDQFAASHVVLGEDPRIAGRGKPRPDIYLLALRSINDALPADVRPIEPNECLVFEDAVLGVQAGRRAGMRVVWVPHPGLAAIMKGKEAEVLAAKQELLEETAEKGVSEGGGDEAGEIWWAEQLDSLETFPYDRYGIVIPQSEGEGTEEGAGQDEEDILDGIHV